MSLKQFVCLKMQVFGAILKGGGREEGLFNQNDTIGVYYLF